MAWVKIPKEHHPIFLAAVPNHPVVTTLKMFGGIAAKANGYMFAGLFAKSFVVKLAEPDREQALKLDGATVFDPMGNGRVMADTIHMPEETFGDDIELRAWLRRGLDYTLTLSPKAEKKPAAAKPTVKPAKKAVPKKVAKPVKKLARTVKKPKPKRAGKPSQRH